MIDFDKLGKEGLYNLAIDMMDRHTGARFSSMLNTDCGTGALKYFDDRPCSWLRFKSECRRRGWGDIIDNIQVIEREILVEQVEKGLIESYNEGDLDGIKVSIGALNGLTVRVKMNSEDFKNGVGEEMKKESDSYSNLSVVEVD